MNREWSKKIKMYEEAVGGILLFLAQKDPDLLEVVRGCPSLENYLNRTVSPSEFLMEFEEGMMLAEARQNQEKNQEEESSASLENLILFPGVEE